MCRMLFFMLTICGTGLAPCLVVAQDVTPYKPAIWSSSVVNAVHSWVAVKPDTNTANIVAGSASYQFFRTSQYIDGLGRPIETVVKQGSCISGGTAVDLVTVRTYDSLMREPRVYLPFGANGDAGNVSVSDGGFKTTGFDQQRYFYSDTNVLSPVYGQGETFYYGKTEIESSALGRPLRTYSAGNNWVGGSGRGISYNYWTNTAGDSVKIWSVANGAFGSFGTYSVSGNYAAGQLNKTVTTDEQGKQSVEFKDREGRVILRKVQTTGATDSGSGAGYTGWLCTYYIYDDPGNLRCVIQPLVVGQLPGASWVLSSTMLNEGCFRYEYDGRIRKVMSKVAGGPVINIVYDVWDRPVLTQDGNQRTANQWFYTKYDTLNRPVVTGIYTDAGHVGLSSMQGYVNGVGLGPAAVYNAASNPVYSLTSSFPSTTGSSVLSYTYYDDYSWASWYSAPVTRDTGNDGLYLAADNVNYPYPQTPVQSTHIKGKVTGKWLSSGEWTVYFYDDYSRVVQTVGYNQTSGVDVNGTQYSFSGLPLVIVSRTVKTGTNAQTLTVLTKTSYDSLGRPSQVQKKIASTLVASGAIPSAWTTISRYSYDALGRVSLKSIGNKPGAAAGTALQNQSFVYNIRGWTLSMNKGYVEGGTNLDQYFGFELGYDKNAGLGSFSALFNGNIAGMLWKGEGDQAKRKYDFTYDAAGRLISAAFNQYVSGSGTSAVFDKSAGIDYTVAGISYDANGNIGSMQQKGWMINSSPTIDSLIYLYQSGSNKLARVTDGAIDTTIRLGDFRNGVNAGDDYSYDSNGNLIGDLNKKIDLVSYNYLNLPVSLHVTGKGNVLFNYNPEGRKLKKIVVDSLVPTVKTTTTLYLGGLVFVNDTLQFIGHEEGRVRMNLLRTAFVYDYYVRDHLGNTRMVLTEEGETDAYPVASLESATIGSERLYYGGLDSGRVNKSSVPGYPSDTYTSPNDYTQGLTGSGAGGTYKVGANILIRVMAGDTINLYARSWYRQNGASPGTPSGPLSSLILRLAGGIVGADPGHYALGGLQQTGVLDPGLSSFLTTVGNDYATHNTKPKAYLNWILLDEQFRYVAGTSTTNSGFRQVGNDTTLTTHIVSDQVLTKSGYLFVYCSNETPNISVYFDDLTLTHRRGRILEETHYYPFGLTMAGISAQSAGKPENKLRYNGKELQNKEFADGRGVDWYDFLSRFYDPQIGRWHVIDPKSDLMRRFSPYNYGFDNPIRFVDPDGMSPDEVILSGDKWSDALKQLQNATTLKITRDDQTGIISASGKAKTDADKALLSAINDQKISVNIEATSSSQVDGNWFVIGGFRGSEVKDDKVVSKQIVNPSDAKIADDFYEMQEGVSVMHEVLESFQGAKDHPGTKTPSFEDVEKGTVSGMNYLDAHKKANSLDPRHKDANVRVEDNNVFLSKFTPDPRIPKAFNPEIFLKKL